jgi:hypothetical protein
MGYTRIVIGLRFGHLASLATDPFILVFVRSSSVV